MVLVLASRSSIVRSPIEMHGVAHCTAGASNVNWSFALVAEVPPTVVTVMSTVPAACAGAVAVMLVALSTVNDAAGVTPNSTSMALLKPVPVIVTDVPPLLGPWAGLTLVTVGAATNVNWSFALVAEVPPTVVTVMSTVPAEWAGAVAVMLVALSTVNDAAAVAPKSTSVAPVKPVPVIVTDVPPVVGPAVGVTLVTVGAATNVNWSFALVAE